MQWYRKLVMKKCSGLISLQLDPLIWETVGPRTHRPKIVNESLNQSAQLQKLARKLKFRS